MKKRYEVKFFNREGKREEAAVFHVNGDENLLDVLEETLYIIAELTPENYRTWKQEFSTSHATTFTYHLTEFFEVSYAWDNSGMIEVREK